MEFSKFYFTLCCTLFIFINDLNAKPFNEEHKSKLTNHFLKFGAACISNHTITTEDLKDLTSFKVPSSKDATCFFACVLKNAEMFDGDGKISTDKTEEILNTIFSNNNDRKAATLIFQDCSYVNDLEVTDGAQGCERAKYVLTCLMDQSRKNVTSARLTAASDGDTQMESNLGLRSIQNIFQSMMQALLKLACLGINKDYLPGSIAAQIIPGIDTANALCAFIS